MDLHTDTDTVFSRCVGHTDAKTYGLLGRIGLTRLIDGGCGLPREDPWASSYTLTYISETFTYSCSRGSTPEGVASGVATYDFE